MEWIEVSAESVKDAVDNALDELGIHKDEIEYEILSEPKKGVFGIGATPARIKARVKPVSREKPRDRNNRKKSDQRNKKSSRSQQAKSEKKPKPTKKVEKMSEQEPQTNEEETKKEYAEPIETQAKYAQEFLSGLVKYFDDSCSITYELEEDMINIAVKGNQVGLLIGSRGATLFSIEELMRAVVQAKVGGYTARMYLDIGEYREKRKEALAEFAKSLADKVKETGVEQVLEPMVSPDRKIVHDTIAEIEGVTTTSEGYDPKRRVVVMLEETE